MHKAVRASWLALLDARRRKVVRSLIASLYILFYDFNWDNIIFRTTDYVFADIIFVVSISFISDILIDNRVSKFKIKYYPVFQNLT